MALKRQLAGYPPMVTTQNFLLLRFGLIFAIQSGNKTYEFMKSTFFLLTAAAAFTVFTAFKGADYNKELIGTWDIDQVQDAGDEEPVDFSTRYEFEWRLEFMAENKFVQKRGRREYEAEWRVDENNSILLMDERAEEFEPWGEILDFDKKEGLLTVKRTENAQLLIFKKRQEEGE